MPSLTSLPQPDQLVETAALRLQRACGARALIEARGWCRYFGAEGKPAERAHWARIALELRRRRRAEPVSEAA